MIVVVVLEVGGSGGGGGGGEREEGELENEVGFRNGVIDRFVEDDKVVVCGITTDAIEVVFIVGVIILLISLLKFPKINFCILLK